MSASSHLSFEAAQQERDYWGRLVESAVGAHLVNSTRGKNIEVFYWLERNREVDFILRAGNNVAAIEVKSGRRRERLFGIEAFSKAFRVKRQLWVGEQGIPVGEFLSTPIERWLR
jgi:predicted AAA+ superfamily ATPase